MWFEKWSSATKLFFLWCHVYLIHSIPERQHICDLISNIVTPFTYNWRSPVQHGLKNSKLSKLPFPSLCKWSDDIWIHCIYIYTYIDKRQQFIGPSDIFFVHDSEYNENLANQLQLLIKQPLCNWQVNKNFFLS